MRKPAAPPVKGMGWLSSGRSVSCSLPPASTAWTWASGKDSEVPSEGLSVILRARTIATSNHETGAKHLYRLKAVRYSGQFLDC